MRRLRLSANAAIGCSAVASSDVRSSGISAAKAAAELARIDSHSYGLNLIVNAMLVCTQKVAKASLINVATSAGRKRRASYLPARKKGPDNEAYGPSLRVSHWEHSPIAFLRRSTI